MARRARGIRIAATAALAVCCAGAVASTAEAKPFLRGFAEPAFEHESAEERAFWFDQSIRANTNIARINVSWRGSLAGGKPVLPTNPNDPGYNFARADRAVIDAATHGQQILITVFDAPEFAEGSGQPGDAPDGTWRPDPAAIAEFAEAIATRYSGNFIPVGGVGALPRVQSFEAWNEPNLSQYLTPQYDSGKGKQVSGDLYRGIVNAFYDGVQAAGSGAAVVAGATAPFGDPAEDKPTRTRPLIFLREAFCLNNKLKGVKCSDPARFDIVSHHPITIGHGPDYSALSPDDASMADFDQVIKTVRAAEKQNTIGGANKHPAWATEFWWETKPPDGGDNAVPIKKHARWMSESQYTLWKQGAEAAIHLRLQDDESQADSIGGEQSGLFFFDRTEKLSFEGFRFPFVGDRTSKKKVKVWTISPTSGSLEIQEKRGSGYRTIGKLNVSAGKPEQTNIKLSGKPTIRGVVAGDETVPYAVK